MYICNKCYWKGSQLNYTADGQGECPECKVEFVGCVNDERYKREMAQARQELPDAERALEVGE